MSIAHALLTNPTIRSDAKASKQLVGSMACAHKALFGHATWPSDSSNGSEGLVEDLQSTNCDNDPVAFFNSEVTRFYEDYSITQGELVKILGDTRTPLKGLGKAVDEYTRGRALAAFSNWTKGLRSLAKQGMDLSLDSRCPEVNSSRMAEWRRIDYIPTEKGLLYLSNRDIFDGDLRLWAGARQHHVLTVIDADLLPERQYKEWRLPEQQSLRLDIRDKSSQADTQELLRSLPKALDFIAQAIAGNHSVIVHCAAGQSRSVAVVLAHKMVSDGLSLAEAFAHVVAQRPQAQPNPHFMKALVLLDDSLKKLPKGDQRKHALMQLIEAIPGEIGSTMTSSSLELRVPGYSSEQAEAYYNNKLKTGEAH